MLETISKAEQAPTDSVNSNGGNDDDTRQEGGASYFVVL